MDQIRELPQTHHSLDGFIPLLSLTEALGALLVILVLVWTTYFRNGFSWRSNPTLEFNWHPLLMTIGLVFLYANAMLIYRTQRNLRKRRLKLIHAGKMILIMLVTVIALVAVFDSHNLASPPIPNMYSLHSWIGLTTVILFCCQWVAGCVSFLFPGLHASLRAAYMPIHMYFGVAGFVGAIASCLLGLNEKAIFVLKDKYSSFDGEGVLINIIGLLFISFGGLSVYLVTQVRYRRLPMPEDEVLLSGTG
ncbi:cytochrome b561 isoform X2 [Harpegnathos saltator]|uniref:Cytochrome b561 n=2 Tax=Harpegnathos saltator TaxID=610380 RepID=E2BWT9_HARSA|nr:cytochrome b561 isoform X2 [Harpegnathos saltator]EFN79803.1 Cytochrome b561 [Harpegnathos saltator]